MSPLDSTPTQADSASVKGALAAMEELTIALAAQLARDGRRKEAEELLLALPEPASPERSDLLARLLAQRGDLDGAEQYWRKVPSGHCLAPAARAGLRRIDILRRRPSWLRFNLWFGMAVLAACAVAACGVTAGVLALASSSSTGESEGGALASSSTAASVSASATPSPSSSASPVPSSTPESTVAASPPVNLEVRGASVSQRDGALIVTFDRGLFRAGGAALTKTGQVVLGDVAERIKAAGQPVALRVVGHTDNVVPHAGAAYSSNMALGYARAAAAAAYLTRAAGLPLSAVSAASAGSSKPVADNATRTGRQRNRTVVLEVRSR